MADLKGASPAERPLNSLHDVVLDYLNTQAYASTARALAVPRTWKRGDTAGVDSGSSTSITHGIGGSSMGNGNGNTNGDGTNGDGGTAEEEGMEVDADGDGEDIGDVGMGKSASEEEEKGGLLSERNLVSMERRRAILNYILNGAIMRAVGALNTHFPSVLTDSDPDANGSTTTPSNGGKGNGFSFAPTTTTPTPPPQPRHSLPPTLHIPPPPPLTPAHSLPTLPRSLNPAHIRLNLSIQSFIETFRELVPPSGPSSPSSSIGSLSGSHALPSASGVMLTHAVASAQGLHTEAKKLNPADRAMYLEELKDVGGLFAYPDPENSIVRGFMEQGRRIALAEQVNRAILHSENRSTRSKLEDTARRVSALWTTMTDRKIDPTPNWTAADGAGREDLALYFRNHPKRSFNLREFVAHSAT